MNDLQKAYSVLGLEPGAPMEAINRRYKRLVLVWHPDRFHNEEGKREAEQELKAINSARDLLKDHFVKGGHKETGPCSCRADSGQQSAQSKQNAHGPGPGPDRTNDREGTKREQEASRKREADSRRSSAEDGANRADQAAKAAHEQTMHNAFRKGHHQNHDSVRWRISLGCAAIFVLSSIVLIVSDGLEQPIISSQKAIYGPKDDNDESKQLSDEWRSYQNDKAQVAYTLLRREPVSGETSQWRPPFVSNDRSAYWLSRWAYQQLVVRVEEQTRKSAQDLSNARMDVERYQNAIEFSQKRLADAEAKLADSTISALDRQFATSDQATQFKFLQENQVNLKYAQQRLNELQGDQRGIVATQPKISPDAPGQPTKSLLDNVNTDTVVRPDGSIKSGAGSLLHFNDSPTPGS
jgi:curved DNA-binding protein CbpA